MININEKLTPERAKLLIKNGSSRQEIKKAYNLNNKDYEIMCNHPQVKGVRRGVVPTLDMGVWGTPESNGAINSETVENRDENVQDFNNIEERW